VTTGAQTIYLVSACGSGEDFVAAFRRYADRNGLFVPMADPIPAGRRGRFAIALKSGGVMIEGDAEVVSSTRTPSGLHGRAGMTLRFVGPDEQSRTVLVELEKARLAMKPPPPSVPPRPADIPAAPRPVPPRPGGRIDATNALAECVAIGDVGALGVVEQDGAPRKPGPKFVMPSIPVAARSAAAPPASSIVYDEGVELPTWTEAALPAQAAPPVAAPPPRPGRSTGSMPPVAAPPARPGRSTGSMPPARPAPRAASEAEPLPPPPADLVPAPPIVAARPRSGALAAVEVHDEPTDLTTIPQDALEPLEPAATAEESPGLVTEQIDAQPAPEPITDQVPAQPPPAPPRPPIVGVPPQTPVRPPNVEEPTPTGDWTMVPGATGPTLQPRTPKPRPEGSPAGDWSISLDPRASNHRSEPPPLEQRPAPATAAPPARAAAARPPRRLRSDPMPIVTSSRPLESDPQRPVAHLRGASEPKVQVDPTLIEPLVPLPTEDPPPVDPSGSQQMLEQPMAASSSSGMRLQQMLTPMPGFAPPYPAPPFPPSQAAVPFPPSQDAVPFAPSRANADATVRVRVPSGPVTMLARAPRRTRMIVIAASAALVLAVAVVLIVASSGGEASSEARAPRPAAAPRSPAPAPAGAGSARAADKAAVSTDGDAAQEAPAPVPVEGAAGSAAAVAAGAGSAAASTADEPCSFDVTTAPAGAEILLGTSVVGTTPATLTQPCGVQLKLTFRKPRYLLAERKYTPAPKGKPLKVTLARPTVSVKVSSSPAGATVTVGRRSQGVTPTTIRLPANQASVLTFSKEGFISDTQRITPKPNQAVHTNLKRTPRKVPR
jgi:hypothetical protein